MGKVGEWETEQVIKVLLEGQEWGRQLQQCKSTVSEEQLAVIASRINICFNKGLSMLKCADPFVGQTSDVALQSAAESPLSVVSRVSKKRKMLPKRTEKISACMNAGMEAPMDDGFSWRKYGQKIILAATYPRGYFRCTHKNTQGCHATKQVQKSDDDPTIFDVVYKGSHTCTQAAQGKARSLASSPENHVDKKPILLNVNSFKVTVEESDGTHNRKSSSNFSFPPASLVTNENPSDMFSGMDNPFTGSFSPASFISPETSESNYYCFTGGLGSDSELHEIISAATSLTNSPMLDLDSFSLDVNFAFDEPDFFA